MFTLFYFCMLAQIEDTANSFIHSYCSTHRCYIDLTDAMRDLTDGQSVSVTPLVINTYDELTLTVCWRKMTPVEQVCLQKLLSPNFPYAYLLSEEIKHELSNGIDFQSIL